jgi:ACR3 family arsenite efflux pump ArsB
MRKRSMVLVVLSGSVAGLFAGGMASGWLPVLIFCHSSFAFALDSPSLFLGGLAFLLGAAPGAATGASYSNRACGRNGSWGEALLGAASGLAIGSLLAVAYWLLAMLCDLDWGRIFWAVGIAILCIPLAIGAVIGADWRAGHAPRQPGKPSSIA